MTSLLQIVATAPSSKPIFAAAAGIVTAGHIRNTAMGIVQRLPSKTRVCLHTNSASLFVAALLAAAHKELAVCFPAHLNPLYLREVGADEDVVLTDQNLDFPAAIRVTHTREAEAASCSVSGDLDLVFYTSGVTGKPKAISKRIAQIDAEAATLERVWPKGAQRVFGTVSHQHIYGMLFRIFWPVHSGGISSDQPAEYWEQLATSLSPGSTLVSGPAHLTRLPAASHLAHAAPQLIFSSGGPLSLAAARAVDDQFGSPPVEILGSTETGGIAWRQQDRDDALWNALPGVRIAADDEGRLSVRSPFANPDEPVSTGDIVEFAGERFRLKGRGDRIAKIDGKRVSLARVEEELFAQPIVDAAVAIDLPARKGALGAIVQLNALGQAALAEQGAFRLSRTLRHALSSRLEPVERPKHWHFGAIPLDRQGKRVQAALRAVFDGGSPKMMGRGTVTDVKPDAAEILIELTPDMIWFEGHFPGQPVLAGIAQVHIAALWAEHVWKWKPPGGNLSQLKFRRILRPGDTVQLRLVRLPEKQRLKFAYRMNELVTSEGTIEESE